ncbi:MAG: hypothetical protein EA369_06855 [Bradymonadales bacterium]|nr:MAG: hypothetical protein EA369_06855 [Bradymonadales bacterium]
MVRRSNGLTARGWIVMSETIQPSLESDIQVSGPWKSSKLFGILGGPQRMPFNPPGHRAKDWPANEMN